jgi:hypothetical protein
MKNSKSFLMILLIVVALVACNKNEKDNFSPMLLPEGSISVVGANNGGNIECEEVGTYPNTSGRIDYKGGTGPWTVGPITWSTDGTYVTWSSSVPVKIAVIVKGGPNASVYKYEDKCTTGATRLTAPINPNNGKPYGLSNITFCYSVCELVVGFKSYMGENHSGGWVTTGEFITAYPLVLNASYQLDYLHASWANTEAIAAGSLTITDLYPTDGHWEITVDNNAMPSLKFSEPYLYVGSAAGFSTDFHNYPYPLIKGAITPANTWRFVLPFQLP